MADEAVWVPQAPARSQGRYHSRSSSIGWKGQFPFIRRRTGSATESSTTAAAAATAATITRAESPGDKSDEMASSLSQGLRKKGARAFKQASATTNDTPAAGPPSRQLLRSRTDSPTFSISTREDKLASPDDLLHPRHTESAKSANIRKSKSFDDLKQETAAALSAAASKTNWEDRRKASGKIPTLGRRSPAISPSPEPQRPSRASSSSPRPVPSGNAWRQEAKACPKADNKTESSSLPVITEHKFPTPPQSPGTSPMDSSPVKSITRERRVDGVDFEMLIPPSATSASDATTESSDDASDSTYGSYADDLATWLDEVRTPADLSEESERKRKSEGRKTKQEEESEEESDDDDDDEVEEEKESRSASPAEAPSTIFKKNFAFPAPPIPQTPLEVQRARWTMMSSSRASSIFLPDTFEQPESGRRHKRASSENDAAALERQNSVGSVLSRPPTPPPKGDKWLRPQAPPMVRYKSAEPISSLVQTPRLSIIPPTCPRGTLPTPRSKFNPHPTTPAKTSTTTTSPSAPTSAGARIAAAAVKEPASTIPSRRASFKQKPPARSPPPVPLPVTAPVSKSTSPTGVSSSSTMLKRRSSDLDDRVLADRARRTATSTPERSRSQIRRDMAKKMALDNIGAVKPARPSRTPSKANLRERKPSHDLPRPEMISYTFLELESTRRDRASPRTGNVSPELITKPSEELIRIKASEAVKISALTAELQLLEKQKQDLNERMQRLQVEPVSSSSDEPSAAPMTRSGSSIDDALGNRVENWKRGVHLAESSQQKRDKIRKKLAWESTNRLKLAPRLPRSIVVTQNTASLRGMGVSMGIGTSMGLSTFEEESTDCPTAKLAPPTTDRHAITGDELSMTDEASIDENAEIPSTPDEYSPPMTAANNPWLGLDNPFLAPVPSRPAVIVESIKSPVTVVSARSDRQTIQMFADDDIMADAALSAAAATAATAVITRNITGSPMPRRNKSVTIQVFADDDLADTDSVDDLVSALQQEIDDLQGGFVCYWERPGVKNGSENRL